MSGQNLWVLWLFFFLIQILLGGTPVRCRNRHFWIQAVQDSFEDVLLGVPCRQLLQYVCETTPQRGAKFTWLHRMVATMLVTLRHSVGALFFFWTLLRSL